MQLSYSWLVRRFVYSLGLGLLVACAAEDTRLDASTPTDAAARDAAVGADVRVDAPSDGGVGADNDAGMPQVLRATPGQRCRYDQRRGLIAIRDEGGPSRWVSLELLDKPSPWLGPAALTSADGACLFHRASPGCACQGAQICDVRGQCVDLPRAEPAVELAIVSAGGTQLLRGDGNGNGDHAISAEVTAADAELALRVTAGSLVFEVPALSVPPALIAASGTLAGTYDAPRSVEVLWTAPADAAEVYSLTNINHHVADATFTECVVPAARGRLFIDEPMLTPLAVATGLEFQALQHVRFAAVDTPTGCIEVRMSRTQYVNLE
jgi:hypothetical protein